MKLVALVIAVASVLAALVGSLTQGSSASIEGSSVFIAVDRSTAEDRGRTVSVKQIRDRHGDVVGWGNTVCLVLGNGSAQCIGTFVLPEGKVSVAGTRRNREFYVFAVVGGTGVYTAAGGTLLSNKVSDGPFVERLIFNFEN